MDDLQRLRYGWDEVEAEETRLLRQLTVPESIAQFLALQTEFEPWLQETETIFRQQRFEAITSLQQRLLKLNQRNGATMKNLTTAVVKLQKRLDSAGIPSMVIGGLAVGAWGEPRLTRDADLKVLASRSERKQILDLLAGYTPLQADADESLRRLGFVFLQDEDGVRIDVMLAETSFDETAIGRARQVPLISGEMARVCTAEDLIVYKMVSLRPQDRADVEGVVRRQGKALDHAYVEKWLREFEQALDDSTLLSGYHELRQRFG